MARPAPDRLVRSYRAALERIRRQVLAQIDELYAGVDLADVNASFAAFIADAAPVVAAGQGQAAALAVAFLRSYSASRRGSLIDIDDELEDVAGTTKNGKPLPEGMAAFGPMVLIQIANGRSLEEVREYGHYIASRFADNELTSAADRTIDLAAERTGRVTGWEGIVDPDACDPCQGNAGEHPIDEPIYRHPDCNCQRIPVVA